MYVIDLTHYLDPKGTIAPERGPARFKCRKRDHRIVETGITEDDVVVWRCLACGTEGRISNWQETFWDLSQGTPSG